MDRILLRAVLTGVVHPLGSEGVASGIAKHAVEGPIRVTKHGVMGDEHADLRNHGGLDKALHHYPCEHYV
jgi:MOSC domain-containing protein YiiM